MLAEHARACLKPALRDPKPIRSLKAPLSDANPKPTKPKGYLACLSCRLLHHFSPRHQLPPIPLTLSSHTLTLVRHHNTPMPPFPFSRFCPFTAIPVMLLHYYLPFIHLDIVFPWQTPILPPLVLLSPILQPTYFYIRQRLQPTHMRLQMA